MAELVKPECCSVCLDNFIKPTIIDCKHVFCEACLEDVVQKSVEDNKFPCPLCRVIISIPSDGTSGFPEYTANNEDGASRYLTSSEEEVKPTDGTSGFPENTGNNEDGASRYLTSSEEDVKPTDRTSGFPENTGNGASRYPTSSEEDVKPTDRTSGFPENTGNNEDGASRYPTSSEEEVKPADDEESEDDEVKCEVCTNDVNAEFECIECDKLMCNACKTPHDVFFKLHHVDSLQGSNKENTLLCMEHEGEELEYFCVDCNEPVCGICQHLKHTDHNTPDIEDYIETAKTDLSQIQKEFNNYIYATKRTLIKAKQTTDKFGRMIDDKIKKIKQMCDELKSDFKILCFREEAKITNDRHLLQRLETAVRCISKAVDDDSYVNVLDALSDMKSQYEEMQAYVPSFDIKKLNDIFTKELSTVLHARSFKYTFNLNSKCHIGYDGPDDSRLYSPRFIVGGCYWQISLAKYFWEVNLFYIAPKHVRNESMKAEITFKVENEDEMYSIVKRKVTIDSQKTINVNSGINYSDKVESVHVEVMISIIK